MANQGEQDALALLCIYGAPASIETLKQPQNTPCEVGIGRDGQEDLEVTNETGGRALDGDQSRSRANNCDPFTFLEIYDCWHQSGTDEARYFVLSRLYNIDSF